MITGRRKVKRENGRLVTKVSKKLRNDSESTKTTTIFSNSMKAIKRLTMQDQLFLERKGLES